MKVFALQCVGLLVCVCLSFLTDDPKMRAALLPAEIPLLFHIARQIRGVGIRRFGERHRLLVDSTVTAVCVIVIVSLTLTVLPLAVVALVFLVAFGVCGAAAGVYLYMRRLFGILLHRDGTADSTPRA